MMVARLKRLQDLGSRQVRRFVWTINTWEERQERSGCRGAAGRKAKGKVSGLGQGTGRPCCAP